MFFDLAAHSKCTVDGGFNARGSSTMVSNLGLSFCFADAEQQPGYRSPSIKLLKSWLIGGNCSHSAKRLRRYGQPMKQVHGMISA